MSLANYADLVAAVASWSNRSDLTTQIPDFIALAEARMGADITTKALDLNQSAIITASVAVLPDNVRTIKGLRIVGANVPTVEVTSQERLDYLTQAGYVGTTTYGALIGREVHFVGTTAGTLEVRAKCAVPALETNVTNWLMTNFPNAYLFGALVELAGFLKDKDGLATWEPRYQQVLGQVNGTIGYAGQAAASKVWGVR